jgi:pimeloyl-ACP methyl ester carboxylesterase
MRRPTHFALTAAMLFAAGCGAESPSPATSAPQPPSCTQETVPVTLDPSDSNVYHIIGRLCRASGDEQRAHTVQLLVSGITYSHQYWDSSYQPETYSYVHAANAHGYSTFAIDRLGVGDSDHPPADKLTLQAHAKTVAQIVSGLRSGAIGGTAFANVVGVGHSFGAGVLQYLAGTATDPKQAPDLLILTGYLSTANPQTLAQIGNALYPAADDPAFATANRPDGYLTTRPGTRTIFVGDDADPALVALDEREKDTTTLAERTSVGAARDPLVTRAITVPVLLMVGERDLLACAEGPGLSCAGDSALITRERDNFVAACLDAFVVPGAPHAINVHRNAGQAYDRGNTWVDALTANPNQPANLSGCR